MIETYYLPPTDTKGGRIKARSYAFSVTLGWDHSLDVWGNHARALRTLLARHDHLSDVWIGGRGREGGYVWVPDNGQCRVRRPTKHMEEV